MLLLYVAAGGAFGALCRYLMTEWLTRLLGRGFPYATLMVNVLGSFLMGLAIALIVSMLPRGRELYMLLAVGALSGFTTFSYFAFDAYLLMERALFLETVLYVCGTVMLSVVAFFFGMGVYKWLIA